MGKIKFTKTEQKNQQDLLKQFKRFLPTLQLKKQQLQNEVRLSNELLEANLENQKQSLERLNTFIALFGDKKDSEIFAEYIKVIKTNVSIANIAGIEIPVFKDVEFENLLWDKFATDWYFDDCIQAIKDAVSLRAEYKVIEEQHRLLSQELRVTSQRVNLFEKVKIPECQENIRKIRIMLGDLETSAVARCKIAKRKSLA